MTAHQHAGGALATLSGRLTARDRWLLRMLHEHTVLTTTHLHHLRWASTPRQVQARARTLNRLGVLDRFRPLRPYGHGSAPLHLILGPVGAQILAAETGLTPTDLGYRGPTRAQTIAHRLTLAHDIATTDLVCDLAATPTVNLVRWWSARRCGRYFGHHVHPDAYLTLTTPTTPTSPPRTGPRTGPAWTGSGDGVPDAGGWWEMLLEYDTGSENLTQLTDKITGYHALAEHTGLVTPVGIWFTRPRREPSARRALADAVAALPVPARVPILTGTPHTAPPHTAVPHTAVPHTAVPADVVPSGAPPGRGRQPARWTTAGGRVWLPLHPGAVERVDLATLASTRPAPLPGSPTEPARPGFGDPGGPLPAPCPRPPSGRGVS